MESQLLQQNDPGSFRVEDLGFEDLMQSVACDYEAEQVETSTAGRKAAAVR